MVVACVRTPGTGRQKRAVEVRTFGTFENQLVRRGQQRALMAIAHTMLIIIWHMLAEGTVYTEIGVDYLARNDNPDRRRRHLLNQLEHLGYQVALTPAA